MILPHLTFLLNTGVCHGKSPMVPPLGKAWDSLVANPLPNQPFFLFVWLIVWCIKALAFQDTQMCLSSPPQPLPPPSGRHLLFLTLHGWPEQLWSYCQSETASYRAQCQTKVQAGWEGSGDYQREGAERPASWGTVCRGQPGKLTPSCEQRPEPEVKEKKRTALRVNRLGKGCDKNSVPPDPYTMWHPYRFSNIQTMTT